MGCCFSCASTGSVNVIEQFGRFDRIAEPGIQPVNFLFGKFKAGTVSLRLQSLQVRCETKTLDNVFIHMEVSIQYKVTSAEHYFYKLTNPHNQMLAYVYDVVRAQIPKIKLDDVFTTKEDIASEIKGQLSHAMSLYGVEIVATPVTDIDPDQSVKKAMNEIVRQERLREAAEHEGEVLKTMAVKKAQAEAERVRITAEAEAEAQYLSGVGTARQRRAIISGMQHDVKAFSDELDSLDPNAIIDVVLLTQYFNTLREVASESKTNTLFVPSNPGTVQDLSQQLRSSILQANEVARVSNP